MTDVSQFLDNATLTGSDLHLRKIPKIPYLHYPFLIKGHIHLLSGLFGQMKSYLSLHLAAEAHKHSGIKTIYIDVENSELVILRRIKEMGVPDSEHFHYWGSWSSVEVIHRPPPLGHKIYRELAKEYKPLFIWDTYDGFHGADENRVKEMRKPNRELQILSHEYGATSLVLQQKGKGTHVGGGEFAESQFRGSTAIAGDVDLAYEIKDFKQLPHCAHFWVSTFKARIGSVWNRKAVYIPTNGFWFYEDEDSSQNAIRMAEIHQYLPASTAELVEATGMGQNRIRSILKSFENQAVTFDGTKYHSMGVSID